jgi:hypothetical protein
MQDLKGVIPIGCMQAYQIATCLISKITIKKQIHRGFSILKTNLHCHSNACMEMIDDFDQIPASMLNHAASHPLATRKK